MAADKLTVAEDLIRRALALSAQAPTAYYRKLLGDVLAGQQQASAAVEEYKRVIADGGEAYAAADVRIAAAEKCVSLLVTLGRSEEAASVRDILDVLRMQSPSQ